MSSLSTIHKIITLALYFTYNTTQSFTEQFSSVIQFVSTHLVSVVQSVIVYNTPSCDQGGVDACCESVEMLQTSANKLRCEHNPYSREIFAFIARTVYTSAW